MSRWQKWMMVAVAVAVVAIPATLKAADAAPAAAPAPSEHQHLCGAWLDKFHKPFDGFTMGLDIRLREEYAPNMMSMNKQQGDGALPGPDNANQWNRQRYRARWSMSYAVSPDIDLNARLVWEMSTWRHTPGKQHMDDEILFDRLNVTWRNAFNAPLTLVIGRQDLMFGNGWLVGDGTPTDGSRTVHFDAARATYELSDRTKIDLVGILNYDAEDKWLHPMNYDDTNKKHFTDHQDEVGGILYITDKWNESTTAEYYYMYKEDDLSDWHKFNTATRPAYYDDEIHTIGAALSGKFGGNWGYRTEIAKQFGKKGMESMSGLGTNNRLTYSFKDDRNSVLNFDYEYLSGNKPGTSKNEAFDPLWGEWPQFTRGGDLPAYMWGAEQALGEVTNLHRAGVGYTFDITPKWSLQTNYNLLWADQEYTNPYNGTKTGPTGTQFSEDGLFRGQMITGYLKYKCCKNLSMHFLVDYFQPGGFFSGSDQDHAVFLRYNLEFTF